MYSAELIRAYDEAIAGILRDLIRMPGFSIADAMSSDDIGGNILHKLAYYGMGGTIQVCSHPTHHSLLTHQLTPWSLKR